MADNTDEPKGEIPTFRITEKKVDDSWKEEVRRERAAAKGPEAPRPAPAQQAAQHGGSEGEKAPPSPAPSQKPQAQQPQQAAGKPTPAEQQAKIFMHFLAGLAQQALIQMGEIDNPYSGQRDIDLQGARYSIELLATIQAKTKGNLSEDEEGSLTDTIHDLKLRYIEVVNEVQRQQAARAPRPPAGGGQRG